jgi:hypothetical protein
VREIKEVLDLPNSIGVVVMIFVSSSDEAEAGVINNNKNRVKRIIRVCF